MKRGSVCHSLIKTIVDVAEGRGASRSDMLLCIALSEASLRDVMHCVSTEKLIELFQLIIKQTGDEAIGLHVAEQVRPWSFSALGYAMMSCSNVSHAMRLQKTFGGAIADCAELALVKGDKHFSATFTVTDTDYELVRPINDMFMAIFWVYGKWITRVNAKLVGASFTHSSTSYINEYKRIFNVIPSFNETVCGITLDLDHLDAPLFQTDAEMNRIMMQKAELMQRSMREGVRIDVAVESRIRKYLPLQKATLTKVACSMNMSDRSLSRKLKIDGFSFKVILANVRSSMALEYLNDLSLSVINLYSLLGYRDYSAFSHAFRNWTGYSPTEYREKIEQDIPIQNRHSV